MPVEVIFYWRKGDGSGGYIDFIRFDKICCVSSKGSDRLRDW